MQPSFVHWHFHYTEKEAGLSIDFRVEEIEPSHPTIPERLSTFLHERPNAGLWIIGSPSLLSQPWLALFCSSKCPGSLILQAYDRSLALQKAGVPLASGFHSPVEQDSLRIALRGEQQILVCPARGLEGMRIRKEYQKPISEGRLLLASIFPGKLKRPTAETACDRNRFVAALAEKVLVIHTEPGGKI